MFDHNSQGRLIFTLYFLFLADVLDGTINSIALISHNHYPDIFLAFHGDSVSLQVTKNIFLLKSLDELFQKGREAVDFPALQELMQKVCP